MSVLLRKFACKDFVAPKTTKTLQMENAEQAQKKYCSMALTLSIAVGLVFILKATNRWVKD